MGIMACYCWSVVLVVIALFQWFCHHVHTWNKSFVMEYYKESMLFMWNMRVAEFVTLMGTDRQRHGGTCPWNMLRLDSRPV